MGDQFLAGIFVEYFFASLKEYNDVFYDTYQPGLEEIFLAIVCCRNLADFSETAREILNRIPYNPNYPDIPKLRIFETALRSLYREDFMIEKNDELLPNWSRISSYIKESGANEDSLYNVWKFYDILRKNISCNPQIEESLRKNDKSYFINNFDELFSRISFKDDLSKFKNLLTSSAIPKKDEKCLMEFLVCIIQDISDHEAQILDLKKDRKLCA